MDAVSSELALVSSLRTQDSLESEELEGQGSKATSTTLRTQSARGASSWGCRPELSWVKKAMYLKQESLLGMPN